MAHWYHPFLIFEQDKAPHFEFWRDERRYDVVVLVPEDQTGDSVTRLRRCLIKIIPSIDKSDGSDFLCGVDPDRLDQSWISNLVLLS